MNLKIDKSNWIKVKLNDVCEWYQKNIPNEIQFEMGIKYYVTATHIDSDSIKFNRFNLLSDGQKGPTITKHFQKGDLLLSTRSVELRKAALAPIDGVTGEKLLVIRLKPNSQLTKELMPFVFQSIDFWEFAQNSASGSVNKFTSWTKIREYEFLLPTRKEQANLAELLWAMDEVIEREKNILTKLDIIYERLLLDFFNNESSYDKVELGSLVKIKSGDSPSTFEFASKDYGLPFYKVNDLNETTKFQDFAKEWVVPISSKIIPKNSVIFPKRGAAIMTNKVRITVTNSHVDTNTMALIVKDDNTLSAEFLYFFLYFKKLYKIADTSQIPQINNVHINPYPIYLPSINEQCEFVSKLNNILDSREQIVNKELSSKSLQKSLINQVF